jgi:hypothetical protein
MGGFELRKEVAKRSCEKKLRRKNKGAGEIYYNVMATLRTMYCYMSWY